MVLSHQGKGPRQIWKQRRSRMKSIGGTKSATVSGPGLGLSDFPLKSSSWYPATSSSLSSSPPALATALSQVRVRPPDQRTLASSLTELTKL